MEGVKGIMMQSGARHTSFTDWLDLSFEAYGCGMVVSAFTCIAYSQDCIVHASLEGSYKQRPCSSSRAPVTKVEAWIQLTSCLL